MRVNQKVQYAVMLAGIATSSGVGAGFLSFAGPGSGYVPIRVASAVFALAVLAMAWRRIINLFLRNVLLVLFCLWSALTVFWSADRADTLTSLVGLGSVVILGAGMVVLDSVSRVVTTVMWLFTGTSLLSVALAIVAPAVGTVEVVHPTEGALTQPIGVFAWNSDLGFTAGVAAVFALGLALRYRRWWLIVVSVANVLTVVYSNAAASIVTTAIGIVVVLLLSGRWVAWTTLGLGAISAVGGLMVLGPERAVELIFRALGRSSSLTGRTYLWQATWEQALPKPFGWGFGVSPDLRRLSAAQHAHNGYLQVLFDRGWIGVALICAIILLALVRALRHRDRFGAAILSVIIIANMVNDYLSFASLAVLFVFWQSSLHLPGVLQPVAQTKRSVRVVVSAEVREEIEEVLQMISRVRASVTEIRVDAPRRVVDQMSLPRFVNNARVVVTASRYSAQRGLMSKVLDLGQFSLRVLTRRPAILFTGFSLAKHRIVSAWLGVKHVAYIRGAIYDPEIRGGLSDRADASLLRRILPKHFLTTYWADEVLTIGELNRDVIAARGVPVERIKIVGPVWLEALEKSGSTALKPEPGRAYFLTAAWESHGHHREQEAQLDFARSLVAGWNDRRKLVIRVHPRDAHDYAADQKIANVQIDDRLPGDFLSTLAPGDLLISPLSTLAFEGQYCGAEVVFYEDPVATAAYVRAYRLLGIHPATLSEILDGTYETAGDATSRVFSEISYAPVRPALRERFVARN